MDKKFTKGKWIIEYGIVSDSEELGNIVCLQPEGYHDSMEKWDANALLISKAPELLRMLERIYHGNHCLYPEIHKEIKTLIKEATEL